ncbi:MAG: hypothetical protein ACRDIC_19865 [bacterium]
MKPIIGKFEQMGAQATIREGEALWIDVRRDRRGEFFVITRPRDVVLEVLDVQAKGRHLVLLARGQEKARFLCGHDERHWFVAAIPEDTPATTVRAAKDALKPTEVRNVEVGISTKAKDRRKTRARLRQGEWFFVPAPDFTPPAGVILRNEPLGRTRRGGWVGRPHIAEHMVRFGGEPIYLPEVPASELRAIGMTRRQVDQRIGTGLNDEQRRAFIDEFPAAGSWIWNQFIRDPEVYVRGRVRHPDHKTIVLRTWHRVAPNTELRARAMSNVAFID